MSIDCERWSATASRSDSSTSTYSPLATSQPLTSSSGSTSRSWKGHHRFCLIGVPHSRCRVRKDTSDRWVASAPPIGLLPTPPPPHPSPPPPPRRPPPPHPHPATPPPA